MDNDPKHCTAKFTHFLAENGTIHFPSPPQSPDITSGIECVWHELKHYLNTVYKPRNKDELITGIVTFWNEKLSLDQCNRYINHKFTTLPAIIINSGAATGF